MNPNVFRNLSYGLYLVSAMDAQNGRPTGCIVNSVMQITSSPATVAVSVNHENYTNACIRQSGMFGVSILSEQCSPKIIGRFGFQTGRAIEKFKEVPHAFVEGVPVLEDCCGFLVCKVTAVMEAPTHTVFLGEVLAGDMGKEKPPMTYLYYHQVVKGKTPKTASTYIAEEPKKEKKIVYKCSLCGYEYDGETPFEELPEDYCCPLCGAAKDMFVQEEA